MQLEKNGMMRITNIFLSNNITPYAITNIYPIIAYEILVARGEINDYFKYEKEFDELSNRFNLQWFDGRNIKKELENIDSETLKKYVVYLASNAYEIGSKFSESSNISLSRLVIDLLHINSGDMVFDLGSGKGSFLLNTFEYCKEHKIILKELFGLEINKEDVQISKTNLLIIGADKCWIDNKDFIDGVKPIYNRGFVFPPFGMKTPDFKKIKSQMFNYTFNGRNSYEWVFVDRLLKGLNGNEKRAVAILSSRCMFNDADKEYRDNLIKAGLVETIIDLPAGSLNFNGVKAVVVVFSEGNKEVKVVDATTLVDKDIGKFSKFELDYKKVLELVKDAKAVGNEELLNAHSLSACSLLASKESIFTGTPLNELAEVFTGSQYTSKNFEEMFEEKITGYRILTSSDINDGSVEWNKLQSIDYKEDKFDKYAIKQNDVVITAKSSKVKTVVADISPKEKILVTGGMIIVRPNIQKLNPTFLKIFLDSEKGQSALKAIQRGTVIVSINAKDLTNILIPDTAIDKQNDISRKYNNKLSTYIALKEELSKIENQLRSFNLDEMEED